MLIDIVTIVSGVAATFATIFALIPSVETSLGESFSPILTLIALTLVFLQVSVDRIVLRDAPARFADYGRYIGMYPQQIEAELSKKEPNQAKIEAWVELANTNLNDAASIWPELIASDF